MRKKIIGFISCFLLMVLGMPFLSACGSKNEDDKEIALNPVEVSNQASSSLKTILNNTTMDADLNLNYDFYTELTGREIENISWNGMKLKKDGNEMTLNIPTMPADLYYTNSKLYCREYEHNTWAYLENNMLSKILEMDFSELLDDLIGNVDSVKAYQKGDVKTLTATMDITSDVNSMLDNLDGNEEVALINYINAISGEEIFLVSHMLNFIETMNASSTFADLKNYLNGVNCNATIKDIESLIETTNLLNLHKTKTRYEDSSMVRYGKAIELTMIDIAENLNNPITESYNVSKDEFQEFFEVYTNAETNINTLIDSFLGEEELGDILSQLIAMIKLDTAPITITMNMNSANVLTDISIVADIDGRTEFEQNHIDVFSDLTCDFSLNVRFSNNGNTRVIIPNDLSNHTTDFAIIDLHVTQEQLESGEIYFDDITLIDMEFTDEELNPKVLVRYDSSTQCFNVNVSLINMFNNDPENNFIRLNYYLTEEVSGGTYFAKIDICIYVDKN